MLRTCRKLYREAIDTLYSGNHLSFASYERFVVFTRSIPQPRLAFIRRITIAYIGNEKFVLSDHERYRRDCEREYFLAIISAMPGLQVIGFRMTYLEGDRHCWLPEGGALLLDLIEKRTEMAGCELWYEVKPFTLRRREYGPFGETMDRDEFFARWRVGEKVWFRWANGGDGLGGIV